MLKYASHIIITENANMNLSEIMKWLAALGVFPDKKYVTAFREAKLHPVSSGEMAEGWAHLFQILWRVAPHTAEMLWKTLTCKSIAPLYSTMVRFYAAWYALYSPRYRRSMDVLVEINRLRLPLHEPQDLGQLIREDDHDYHQNLLDHQNLLVGLENFLYASPGDLPLVVGIRALFTAGPTVASHVVLLSHPSGLTRISRWQYCTAVVAGQSMKYHFKAATGDLPCVKAVMPRLTKDVRDAHSMLGEMDPVDKRQHETMKMWRMQFPGIPFPMDLRRAFFSAEDHERSILRIVRDTQSTLNCAMEMHQGIAGAVQTMTRCIEAAKHVGAGDVTQIEAQFYSAFQVCETSARRMMQLTSDKVVETSPPTVRQDFRCTCERRERTLYRDCNGVVRPVCVCVDRRLLAIEVNTNRWMDVCCGLLSLQRRPSLPPVVAAPAL